MNLCISNAPGPTYELWCAHYNNNNVTCISCSVRNERLQFIRVCVSSNNQIEISSTPLVSHEGGSLRCTHPCTVYARTHIRYNPCVVRVRES